MEKERMLEEIVNKQEVKISYDEDCRENGG